MDWAISGGYLVEFPVIIAFDTIFLSERLRRHYFAIYKYDKMLAIYVCV